MLEAPPYELCGALQEHGERECRHYHRGQGGVALDQRPQHANLERKEHETDRHDSPCGNDWKRQVQHAAKGDADHRTKHREVALGKVHQPRRREDEIEAQRDQCVDRAERNGDDEELEDRHRPCLLGGRVRHQLVSGDATQMRAVESERDVIVLGEVDGRGADADRALVALYPIESREQLGLVDLV